MSNILGDMSMGYQGNLLSGINSKTVVRKVKGQLILKCLFGVFNSHKNEQKKSTWGTGTIGVKSNFFVHFLGELGDILKLTDLYQEDCTLGELFLGCIVINS